MCGSEGLGILGGTWNFGRGVEIQKYLICEDFTKLAPWTPMLIRRSSTLTDDMSQRKKIRNYS